VSRVRNQALQRVQAIGQRRRSGLKYLDGFDFVHASGHDRWNAGPSGARRHLFRPEFLAAP
jgi:hypothetical protein